MTVHLMTVGNSIRHRMMEDGWPSGWGSGEYADLDRLGRCGGGGPHQRLTALDNLLKQLHESTTEAALVARVWQEARPDGEGWPGDFSAESTSLRARTGSAAVGADDLVVLLTSDTDKGLASALWNALHIAGLTYPLERIVYAPGDADLQGGFASRGQVWIQVVQGLTLSGTEQFRSAMYHLGRIGRAVLEGRHEDEEIVVHLSGGYKATIPFMLGIAECMRSVIVPGHNGFADVSAVIVHQDSLANRQESCVTVPLRRLNGGDLRLELKPFQDAQEVRRSMVNPSGVLCGYAYDSDNEGKTYRLTPFGVGLQKMLGPAAEAGE